MSEPRKNHLSIDGGQVKADDNASSYKSIPDSDTTEFRKTSKPNLTKSKEKISDEAEEKLLDKEEEAKIVTRVDMADAKYVVGDHRNGDAKIELDANKRQFSGLTKEELLKYADDPFWVRLRWFMFVLFWALWLAMLAGAIAIIVRAPKCDAPLSKTWFQKGPLVDATSLDSFEELQQQLQALKDAKVQGIFTDVTPTYEVLDGDDVVSALKAFVDKAKAYGIRVIVDLTPNFVSTAHTWFQLSVNRTAPYGSYFTWAPGRGYTDDGVPKPPNNWVSTINTSAWQWNEGRKEFYLHQYGGDQPDLNFHNPAVVSEFETVLRKVMKTGAAGVRLHKVRQLVVNTSLPDEAMASGAGSSPGADHLNYAYWRHRHTSDQLVLDPLLGRWAELVDASANDPAVGDTVFTIAEEGDRAELYLLQGRDLSFLRPVTTTVVRVHDGDVSALVRNMDALLDKWPAMELTSSDEADAVELAEFSLVLPAAPVLRPGLLRPDGNDTDVSEHLSQLIALRSDASVEHGRALLAAVPALNSTRELLACARWKNGHTGYLAVYNPWGDAELANASLPSVPAHVTVHHVSRAVADYTNYTMNFAVLSDQILVPARSTVVLSYVPKALVEL